MSAASRAAGSSALSRWTGGAHGSTRSFPSGATGGHSSTRPAAPVRCTRWLDRRRLGADAGARRGAERTPHRPRRAPLRSSGRTGPAGAIATAARRPRPGSRKLRWAAASARASAPWKLKIDCFSSPTANSVRGAARAPSPAKNSSASAAITDHWAGLVSCASSISRWSRPPSSLKSTQGAIPARPSRLRLMAI